MKRPRTWTITAAVAGLLALHIFLGLYSAARQSVTVDEIFHLTGGYFFNKFGDYRIHPDNGVFPQRLHAIPAVMLGAKPPLLAGNEYWRGADSYVVSYQFFYESGNDHWPMLMAARAVNIVFTTATCLLVFLWARRLAGDLAGVTALTLAALSPTLLAHGPIVTTDAATAFFLTASVGAWWLQLLSPAWRNVLVSASLFALACVSKYSAVILLPIFVALTLVRHFTTAAGDRQSGRVIASFGIHLVAAWLVIWMCFGFRYSATAPNLPPAEHFATSFNWMLDQAGWQGSIVRWLRDHCLFPEAFLSGYTHTYLGSLKRAAYLAGEYSDTGWRYFFPLVFLWKSTPGEILGLLVCFFAAALQWRRLRPWLIKLAPLLALVCVYGVMALTSHLNIGHRHLIPLYPALFIAVGATLVHLARSRRYFALLVAALAATQAAAIVTTFPHFLAYFNFLGGAPENRWRLLVDSSLDWGQDLSGLKSWLEENNSGAARPVFLSYFGSGEPGYYKLKVARLPFVNGFKIASSYVRLEPGIYCVSATMLAHVYSPFRGPWTMEWEKEYQTLRTLEPLFQEYATNPVRRAELERDAPEAQWRRTWTRHDMLRFARLCHFLRVRQPDAHIGSSILIYRLSAAELAATTGGSLADWSAAIETASSHTR